MIEIFFPQGFAHDYEWTTRAMRGRHFAVWNDTYVYDPMYPIRELVLTSDPLGTTHTLTPRASRIRRVSKGQGSPYTVPQSPS